MSEKIFPELLGEILSSGKDFSSIPRSISPDVDEILSSITLNNFSSSKIKQIVQEVSDKKNLFNVLSDSGFNFPFIEELLIHIQEVKKSKTNVYNFTAILTLYSFISWCSQLVYIGSMPPVTELLKTLIFELESKYSDLVKKSFEQIIAISVSKIKDDKIFELDDLVLAFVTKTQSVDLLVHFIQYLARNLSLSSHPNFFTFLEKLSNSITDDFFDDSSAFEMVSILKDSILKAPNIVLNLLEKMSGSITSPIALLILPLFGKVLINIIIEKDPITLPVVDECDLPNVVIISNLSIPFEIIQENTFQNGFHLEISEFPPKVNLENILEKFYGEKFIISLNAIVKIIINHINYLELFLRPFLDILKEYKDSEYFVSIYTAIIHICNLLFHQHNINLPTDICLNFFNDIIFHPKISLLNHEEDSFSLLNTLRSVSIELILSDNGEALNEILSGSLPTNPLILNEFFQRLCTIPTIIQQKVVSTQDIVNKLTLIAVNYQQYEIKQKLAEKNKILIQQARLSIFNLLGYLLSDSNTCIVFFTNIDFFSQFLAFSFEHQVSEYVIYYFKRFLIVAQPENITDHPRILYNLISHLCDMIQNRETHYILISYLSALNEGISNHQQLKCFFAVVSSPLYKILITISNAKNSLTNDKDYISNRIESNNQAESEERNNIEVCNGPMLIEDAKNLIREMIYFLAQSVSFITITSSQTDLLINALLSFHDDDFITSFYTKFVQLLAGESLPSIKPCFIIHQPHILKMFIKVLFYTSKQNDILEYIFNLCKYSSLNINACVNSEIDLLLLNILKKDKKLSYQDCKGSKLAQMIDSQKTKRLSEETVNKILELFSIISIRHSSIKAVFEYINLLSFYDNNQIYQHHLQLMNALNEITMSSLSEPYATFSLTDNSYKVPIEVSQSLLNGFTFSFWYNVEQTSKNYNPDIFTVKFGKDLLCKASIVNTTILVRQDDMITESSGTINESIDLNSWHYMTITFCFTPDKTIVKHETDLVKGKNVIMVPLKHQISMSKWSIILGGGDAEKSKFPARITQCGLFQKLTKEQRISLFELGKRTIDNLPITPIKYFFDFGNRSNSETTGFLDVLTVQCGLVILTPLIKQSNLIMNDGSQNKVQLDYVLQIFLRMLTSSVKAQYKFYEDHGFEILSHLIIENWADKATIKTYKIFINMMQSLKNEDIQKKLFNEILVNFSFISKLKVDEQLRIIKLWQTSILDSYQTFALKFDIYDKILASIHQIYTQSSYKLHRQYLFRIIKSYIEIKGLTSKLVEKILSHSLLCTTVEVNAEINEFIMNIMLEHASNNQQKEAILQSDIFVFYIRFFFEHPYDFLRLQVLQLFVCAIQNEFISINFACDIIYSLIENYPSSSISTQNFDFILDNVQSCKVLLPLLCYLAYRMGNECIEKILAFIEPSHEYEIGDYWAVWPFILCLRSKPLQQDQILTFLIKSSNPNLCQLYSQLEFVFANHSLIEDMRNKFISILQTITNEPSADFFEISQYIILFGLKTLTSSISDNKLYPPSTGSLPKDISLNRRRKSYAVGNQDSLTRIIPCSIEEIICPPSQPPKFQFHIKIDSNGNWHHFSLAIQCIELFKQVSNPLIIQNYLFFILTLCGFLESTEFDGVPEFIKFLGLSDEELNENKLAIMLIQYHETTSGRPLIFENLGNQKIFSPLCTKADYDAYISHLRPIRLESSLKSTFNELPNFLKRLRFHAAEFKNTNLMSYIQTAVIDSESLKNLIAKDIEQNKQYFNRLWEILSFENAPWESSKASNTLFIRNSAYTPLVPTTLTHLRPIIGEYSIQGKAIFECPVFVLSICNKTSYILTLKSTGIIFSNKMKSFSISYSSIKTVIPRPNGVQIETKQGIGLTIESKDHEKLLKKFGKYISILNLNESLSILTKKWVEGRISTFKYIYMLNKFVGRSFSDPTFYPIAPWIACEFHGTALKVELAIRYRELSEETVFMYMAEIEPFKSALEQKFPNLKQHNNNQSRDHGSTQRRKSISFDFKLSPSSPENTLQTDETKKSEDISPLVTRRSSYSDVKISLNANAKIFNDMNDIYSTVKDDLILEFYCFPEIFSNINLPSFCSSPLDLVYKLRKTLEDKEASGLLSHWFTIAFSHLFPAMTHPNRSIIQIDPFIKDVIVAETQILNTTFSTVNSLTSPFSAVIIFNKQQMVSPNPNSSQPVNGSSGVGNSRVIFFFANAGKVSITNCTIPQNKKSIDIYTSTKDIIYSNVRIPGIPIKRKKVQQFVGAKSVVHSKKGGFAIVLHEQRVYAVLEGIGTGNSNINLSSSISTQQQNYPQNSSSSGLSCISKELPCPGAVCIAAENQWVAIYCKTSSIIVYYDFKPFCTIQTFDTEIKAITISASYKRIACISQQNIILCDIISECVANIIKLTFEPSLIQITNKWGFVLAYDNSNSFIYVYTINGDFIRQVQLNNMVLDFWVTFSTHSGFDYIILVSDDGKIKCAEVYYMKISNTIFNTQSKVYAVEYDIDSGILSVVISNGKILYIPYSIT